MQITLRFLALLALMLGCVLPAGSAQAQTRTWVSGVGDDGNPCSRTAPCQTFAGALKKTAAHGEINCLDPGGFGTVGILVSITIDCDVATAGIVAGPNVDAIIVSVQASDVVVLRGIEFTGSGAGNGIAFVGGGTLHVENCRIRGFQGGTSSGIDFAPNTNGSTLVVQDTTFTDNLAGILIQPAGGSTVASIDRVSILRQTGGGVRIAGGTGGATVSIANSTISQNGGNGVIALSGSAGNVVVDITRTVLASNGAWGVQSNQTGGGTAKVTLRRSAVTQNAGGAVNVVGGATLLTFGDNNMVGPNGTGFSGPIALQ